MGADVYFDPVVDEHVMHSPMGIAIPAWYFAPQKRQFAETGWHTLAAMSNVDGDGPIMGLDDPASATMILQLAGEFADVETKRRLWEAAEHHIEPTWNSDTGEFTLGLGLNEPYPRGQWNARMMAGWVCTQGAWSDLFNKPNLAKFDEPTVEGIDFPTYALSEARWDGNSLYLAAHPVNTATEGTVTTARLTNITSVDGWVLSQRDGSRKVLEGNGDHVPFELTADNQTVVISRQSL